jgi:hypothetical protein
MDNNLLQHGHHLLHQIVCGRRCFLYDGLVFLNLTEVFYELCMILLVVSFELHHPRVNFKLRCELEMFSSGYV